MQMSAQAAAESVGLFIELPEPRARLAERQPRGRSLARDACVFSGRGVRRVLKKRSCQSLGQMDRNLPNRRESCEFIELWIAVIGFSVEMETAARLAQGARNFGNSERCALQECALPSQTKSMVLKRQRSGSPQLLRCKRRLAFNGLGYTVPPQQPVAVARRNERERNRVRQVNVGFQTLRQHVPNGAASKKMSKVETLRSAVEYIRALQQLLDEHDAISAAFRCGVPSPTLSSADSADPESPHSSCGSDDGSYGHLSSEDQQLLDFTTWFDRY